MADLSKYGPVSVMFLRIDPNKNTEEKRHWDPTTQTSDPHQYGLDYNILVGLLERTHVVDHKSKKRVDVDFSDHVHTVIAVEPIGNNILMVLWQDHQQAAQNPGEEVSGTSQVIRRSPEEFLTPDAPV
jgi:wobble nucleotide-excising tRNase